MSVETVLEFWQAAQEDEALQTKVAAVEQGDRDAALAELQRIGREAGYEFSTEEYEAARLELPKFVLAGGDEAEGEVSAFEFTVGSRLVGPGGALRPGGVLRRGGILNGSLGSTSALYTNYRGY